MSPGTIALAMLVAAGPAKSIYKVRPAIDAPVIAGSVALVAFAYLDSRHLITPRCPCDPREVNGFDRWAIGNHDVFLDTTSDVTAGVAMSVPLVLSLADDGLDPELVEDLTVDGEALAVAGGLVTVAKYTVQRPLPRVYALQAPELMHAPGGYRSFYSGHTTLTAAALFTAASQWTRRRGPAVWPWVTAGAVTALVGVERVAAGRHFPSDVLVGAAMGTAVGLAIPWLHARSADGALSVGPNPRGGALALWTMHGDLAPR